MRQRRLVAALVMHRGAAVSSDRLAEFVWGDHQPNDPAGALYTLASRLRRVLGDDAVLASTAVGYRLEVSASEVDVEAVIAWRAATATLPAARRITTIEHLLSLFRGEPLADLDHVDVLPLREQLVDVRLELLDALAAAMLDNGRSADAINVLRSVVAQRPDREAPVLHLMQALYSTGNQIEALAAAASLRDHLREEFGIDPSPRVTELELAVLRHDIHGQGFSDSPASAGATALPPRTTSFVGRDSEIDDIISLSTKSRLITLLGPGGIGKTSVAIQVAERLREGGTVVHLVELAKIEIDNDLIGSVAGLIGAAPQQSETLATAIVRHLGDSPTLVVLDNCEHVLESVAALASLLVNGNRNVRVLATSREPLRSSGEHRWMLQPLPIDDATTLFLDRAVAIDPTFAAAADDPRVLELCRRLDCLPLALELAASNLSGRGLDAVLAQLDDRFSAFNINHRDAPARHRSLAATLDWSYSRLDPAEQQAFDRLGVFAGSFTIDDARELVGEPAARMLPGLVDRSLVVLHDSGTSARYEMLDTMRAYAHKQRGSALDGDRWLHAHWVLGAATDASRQLMGPHELDWFRWYRRNMASFRQAHQWFLDHGRHDDRIRLVASLIMWAWQHRQTEVMNWAETLGSDTPTDDPDLAATRDALWAIAISRTSQADARAAQTCAEAASRASAPAAALAHYAAAEIGLFVGRYELAENHARRAFELARDCPDQTPLAFFSAIDLAFALGYLQREREAEQWGAEAERWAYRLDCPGAHAWVGQLRAETNALSDPHRARVHAQRCLALIEPTEHVFIADLAGRVLVFISSVLGDKPSLDRLCRHLEAAATNASWQELITLLTVSADVLGARGHLTQAATVVAAVSASAIDPVAILERSQHLVERLRVELTDHEFEQAWNRGQSWSLADAADLALFTLRDAAP